MAGVTIIGTGNTGQAIAGIVTAGGLRAVDAGSLRRARELESLGFLQLTFAATEKISWTGGFGLVN
jgi:predicted dinucleotide-binding enzyme